MLGYLIILFTVVPAVELYLLVALGSRIGALVTIGIVIFTGILGAAMARQQGLQTLVSARKTLQIGRMPTDAMIDGLLILFSAAVLLTPGFITDTLGFLLLIPPARAAVRETLKKRFGRRFQVMTFGPDFPPGAEPFDRGPSFDDRRDAPGAAKPDIVVPPRDRRRDGIED